MRFGVGIPTGCEGMYTPCSFAGHEEVVTSAQMAERLGFYSVWGADFMAPSPSMGITGTQPPSFYEILISLAYVSATTKRIKLGAGTVALLQSLAGWSNVCVIGSGRLRHERLQGTSLPGGNRALGGSMVLPLRGQLPRPRSSAASRSTTPRSIAGCSGSLRKWRNGCAGSGDGRSR